MRQAGRRGLPGDDLVATTSAIIGILARFGWGWGSWEWWEWVRYISPLLTTQYPIKHHDYSVQHCTQSVSVPLHINSYIPQMEMKRECHTYVPFHHRYTHLSKQGGHLFRQNGKVITGVSNPGGKINYRSLTFDYNPNVARLRGITIHWRRSEIDYRSGA